MTKYMKLALLAISIALFGCDGDKKTAEDQKVAKNELVVLATTDLKDVEPLVPQILAETGIKVTFKFGTTMGSIESVIAGNSGAHAAWFANAKWLMTDQVGASRVKRQEKIMTSPLVIGVCSSMAKKMGWDSDKNVTWSDIAKAAGNGTLSYAMSNPVSSNQGFMAVMGVASAFSGKGEALTVADVDKKAVSGFFKGYKGVGDNSTDLVKMFNDNKCVGLNAFINYESWLMTMNDKRALPERLVMVYPHEGVATADYPFMLLDNEKKDDWLKVAEWLKSEKTQRWLVENTNRRSILSSVSKDFASKFSSRILIELPFSPDRKVADALMDAYLNDLRRPIHSTFVLDMSSSMSGQRMESLKAAVTSLANSGSTLSQRQAMLTSRERVRIIPFSSNVWEEKVFEIREHEKTKVLSAFNSYIQNLNPDGSTSLYSAVLTAVIKEGKASVTEPDANHSIVVFTDGEQNTGLPFVSKKPMDQSFVTEYGKLPKEYQKVKIFPIVYGEGVESELEQLAKMSGGQVFSAKNTSLSEIFKKIRSYQ